MADRADKFTVRKKEVEFYSDFDNNFEKNPLTGLLARRTNEESIKQSMRNLALTMKGERFYNANLGSKLYSLIFEPFDEITEELIKAELIQLYENYEPRVKVQSVEVNGNEELNAFAVDIIFGILAYPDENYNLQLLLRRIR